MPSSRLLILLFALCAAASAWAGESARLVVRPGRIELTGRDPEHGLLVALVGADGREADVTAKAHFISNAGQLVSVDAAGHCRASGDGQAEIAVTFDGQSAAVLVVASGFGGPRVPSFKQDIIPIFTKTGCNAGSCHGKLAGQNGFRLSLRGFAPDWEPLHGGAIENVWEEIRQVESPSDAEKFVRDAILKKRRIAGFGHRVYRDRPDPRAELLKEVSRDLATTDEQQQLEEIADVIEAAMWKHKELRPNVDWPTARIYHSLGFDAELFTPLFVAARVIGWSAHVIEQQSANRLIQPRSNYVGAKARAFVPLPDRE